MMPVWKFILLIIVNLIPLALCVWGIVWFIKYLMRWREDGQRLRMEVGKLADEVQQIRKQMGNRQSEDSA
jgi:sensor domain CHASE-containing protein